MNQFVGGRIEDTFDRKWKFVRAEQILSPASTFVFIDVEPPSICYGAFEIPDKDTAEWWHVPGALHNNGADLSFADNHVEYHRWQVPFNRGMEVQTPEKHPEARGSTNDVHWLRRNAHHLTER
jgi:prepilin-type processing-associated H-X9-DG protein